jgi:hypothetical protein
MIAGIFYKGSGLGNQLFRYVFTRCLALDRGFEFGMQNPENFKGASFIKLDMGQSVGKLANIYIEPRINHTDGTDIRTYDFEGVSKITDDTLLDGEFQGEKYFIHRKDEIREWLKVETLSLEENLCILNFRGGEYVGGQDLFLAKKYWQYAIENMLKVRKDMKFYVVTDDIKTAKEFFPNFGISHNLKDDYSKIQSAYYLVLSNSSFALFPAWLNQKARLIICPKYWARHNVSDGYWSCEYNIVNGWMYQDRNGSLHDYESCQKYLKNYKENGTKDTSPIHVPPIPLKKRIAKLIPKKIRLKIKRII